MFNLHPKHMAKIVLEKAMAGKEPKRMAMGGMVAGSNYAGPKKKKEEDEDGLGNPRSDSNYAAPKEEEQESTAMMGHADWNSNYAKAPQDEQEDDSGVEYMAEGGEVGHEVAAEEILSALKAGDAQALASALKSFVEQCWSGMEEAEEAEPADHFTGKDIPLDLDEDY